MTDCKLYYFNTKGRAELIRLLYAYKNVKFEDIKFDDKNTFEDFKPKTPFGSVPVLEVNGVFYAQSMAIARYVARELGLMGCSSLQALKVDMIVDAISVDIFPHLMNIVWGATDEIKNAARTKATETTKKTLPVLEKMVAGDYFLGSEVTLADMIFFRFANEGLVALGISLDHYPKLSKIVKSLKENANIKKYLTCPTTPKK